MIDYYLKFSIYRIGKWMGFFKLKISYLKKSMMTAAIFAMNFFCIYELIFDSAQTINEVSIIGGVIVFTIISVYLVVKKKKFNMYDKDEYKYTAGLDIFFNIHVTVTILVYLYIIFNFWGLII